MHQENLEEKKKYKCYLSTLAVERFHFNTVPALLSDFPMMIMYYLHSAKN